MWVLKKERVELSIMNITKKEVDSLNAVLTIKLEPVDYQSQYDNALKGHQKKVQMPGFRPGKVPVGLVKKMYGKSILVDEINKLLSDTLHKYITENKLDVLGNPLPKDTGDKVDWENPKDIELSYDLGLAPKFNIELSSKDKFNYYTIKIDDSLVENYVKDICARYGSITNADVSNEKDFVYGDFVELDQAGNILEGGIFKSSSVLIERVKDSDTRKKFIGLKPEDKIIVNAAKLSESAVDLAAMLGVDKAKAEDLKSDFQFTAKKISRLVPSEIKQELFDKIYGEGLVKTEDEFRSKIKEELQNAFVNDSERRLYNDVVEALMQKAKFSLPDEFLKRWLMAVNEKSLTYEEVSKEYDGYSNGLKWQLIENKLIKENNITVSREEAIEHLKTSIKNNYKKYNLPEPADADLEGIVKKSLSNEEEAKKLFEKLYGQKIMELFKSKFTIDKKEVTQEEFLKKK